MQYSQAKQIADQLVNLLKPHCQRITIAGSIRRQRPEVGDIEIVCLPKKEKRNQDLFGGGEISTCSAFIQAVKSIKGQRIKGMPDGRYMQILVTDGHPKPVEAGIKLDLFMPLVDDYFRILAIRTGSADYSHKRIAAAWVRKGWCGVPGEGLRQVKDCLQTKSGWVLINKNGARPPVWHTEQEFFKWLGLEYLNPVDREVFS